MRWWVWFRWTQIEMAAKRKHCLPLLINGVKMQLTVKFRVHALQYVKNEVHKAACNRIFYGVPMGTIVTNCYEYTNF